MASFLGIERQAMLFVQVIGETLTLAGYPPWPLRFTQIYHMGRLSGINEKVLKRTLTSYGSVLQRYGT